MKADGVLDSGRLPVKDQVVAHFSTEDQRRGEHELTVVARPANRAERDRSLAFRTQQAVPDRFGLIVRPREREQLLVEWSAGGVEDDVDVLRRSRSGIAEPLTRQAWRSIGRQAAWCPNF